MSWWNPQQPTQTDLVSYIDVQYVTLGRMLQSNDDPCSVLGCYIRPKRVSKKGFLFLYPIETYYYFRGPDNISDWC